MGEDFDADQIAWLISTVYKAACEDDREEAVFVFHKIMKWAIKGEVRGV